eukprot:4453773-Amphidinium_carterae.1
MSTHGYYTVTNVILSAISIFNGSTHLIEYAAGCVIRWRIACSFKSHCTQTDCPENKAAALLISHRQKADTCRKPGTAITMEYQIPGADVRTLVVQLSHLSSEM